MYTDVDGDSTKRRAKGTDGVVEAIKSGAVGFGSLAFVVVFFPLLVLGSAAVLLFLLWPLFLGAHLQYGYVPGTNLRGRETVAAVWYLATFAWLVALAFLPPLVKRYRSAVRLPRVGSDASRGPRPRAR